IRSIFVSRRRSSTSTTLSGSSAICLLRRDRGDGAVGVGIVGILVDPLLDDLAEVADQALDRPRRGVAEGADGVPLDLLADFEQHVDLALLGAAFDHARHHPHHPAGALAAGGALAATLVLV